MSSSDAICEKIHDAHGARWERGGICVACVLEMIDRSDVSAVRKRAALVSVMRVAAVRELLYREEEGRISFISSLLRTLFSAVDSSLLDQTVQVLLQVTLDVPNQALLLFILDQIQSRWTDVGGLKASLSSVMFLGKLLDAHPALSQTLTSSRSRVLECVCAALLLSDEDVKAGVCYVLLRIWSSASAVQMLTDALRQRMCVLLLHTLSNTHTTALTINCLGVVKQMCQYSEVVCVLMNLKDGAEDPLPYQPLPLILKKLLLSAQDSLQVVSVRCVCAVLIHAPLRFTAAFIQADLPEFLLEVMSSGCTDVLLWSVFSCLLLLSEDPLFFSQCHAVYGMEPLVRCLKETLGKSNTEVQKQGLELLSAILDRQPPAVRLFPTASEFTGVCDVIVEGVATSCSQVSMCAVRAANVLLRPNHQSSPVQFSDVRRVVEAVMSKCREISSGPESVSAAGVLLQTLTCFDAACRLLEVCVCESAQTDGVCSAPAQQQQQETLESVCVFLLHCCDTTCIPAFTGVCERLSSPQTLQLFLSVLSRQFALCPAHMTSFSKKLAASGFIRLTVDSKAQLCSGNRNASLNQICCDFLLKLCMCLISNTDTWNHEDTQDVQRVLQESLPSLCCSVSDWPSLLPDIPQSLRSTQFCIIHLLYLSLLHGDRFLCDSAVFSCVLRFIVCVQDQCDDALPACVLSSVLYLLSVNQHSGPRLDMGSVSVVSKVLSSCPALFSRALPLCVLSLIFQYPELSERFGAPALTGRLSHGPEEEQELLELLHTHPAALLNMLGVACDAENTASQSAVGVLRLFLCSVDGVSISRTTDLSDHIRSALMNVLQRHKHTDGLSVLLDVLSVIQSHSSSQMNHTDFKLLYHVSNLVGKMDLSDSELLLSGFNCLYCFLCVCPSHATDRVASLLLGNVRLMELLEKVLSSSPSSSSSSLHCSSLLLLSSLVLLQNKHNSQVQKSISVDLHQILRRLAFSKRETDALLLVCSVRFVQVCLDVDESGLVCVCHAALERPLQKADGALHPLGHSGTTSLMTALSALMLQKQDLLVSAALNCLTSLMEFLCRRTPESVQHMVVHQPWTRFLLFSLLSCDGSLRPAALQLLTLLVRFSGSVSHWKSEVESVCEEVERRGVTDLTDHSKHTLSTMLTQCCAVSPPDDLRMRIDALLESLQPLPPSDASNRRMLRVGRVSVCLSDLTASAQDL